MLRISRREGGIQHFCKLNLALEPCFSGAPLRGVFHRACLGECVKSGGVLKTTQGWVLRKAAAFPGGRSQLFLPLIGAEYQMRAASSWVLDEQDTRIGLKIPRH